jgi:hypothetical protein
MDVLECSQVVAGDEGCGTLISLINAELRNLEGYFGAPYSERLCFRCN